MIKNRGLITPISERRN